MIIDSRSATLLLNSYAADLAEAEKCETTVIDQNTLQRAMEISREHPDDVIHIVAVAFDAQKDKTMIQVQYRLSFQQLLKY